MVGWDAGRQRAVGRTSPEIVGTVMTAPSTACESVSGTVTCTSAPSRSKNGSDSTWICTRS